MLRSCAKPGNSVGPEAQEGVKPLSVSSAVVLLDPPAGLSCAQREMRSPCVLGL